MRKPFYIWENNVTDQLDSNSAPLFSLHSTIALLLKSKLLSLLQSFVAVWPSLRWTSEIQKTEVSSTMRAPATLNPCSRLFEYK